MVLILGGRHKGADYAPIVEAAKGKIRHAILLGEAKELIAKALEGNLPYSMADTMEMAVKMAYEISLPGDAILLSPACSSFDMFRDYKHRGEEFKRAMEKLR
jgi:UDP-N-acetylmuramoylalanine--D-glutamate ligase